MPKIESIRPGGTLDGDLGDYPLADLLLGVLRGNLTGRLSLALAPEPRNVVFFKDGVPVSVSLPDLGVSVARILAERGDLSEDRVRDIVREAEGAGRSESAVIVSGQLLTVGTVDEGRRRRAREQVVRLFDAGNVPFVFAEGALLPADAVLTILQPLPIVYEGLSKSGDRRVVDRFLDDCGSAVFKLGPTYPVGVDPFEWGPEVEVVIQQLVQPRALDELVELGLPRPRAVVALTTLFLAGMLEVQRADRPRADRGRVEPAAQPRPVSRAPLQRIDVPSIGGDEPREPSGLIVHRRSSASPERVRSDPSRESPPRDPIPRDPISRDGSPRDVNGTRPISRADLGAEGYPAQLEALTQRLGPFRGKSYYKMLRLAEGSSTEQVERAYRHLVRQLDEAGEDATSRSYRDALREAWEVLMHPVDGRRYRDLAERAKTSPAAVPERQAFEAPPKLDRALVAMADGRNAEASYLLDWALALDPARRDVRVFRAMLGYFRAPRAHRTGEALALKPLVVQELQRSGGDRRLELCLALILAEEGDAAGAERILAGLPDPSHPMARRAREVLTRS
ncbi:hypothetical protein L6R52_31025 [Myxococcota bacterium]|nr:hypothetical protein [Myxococcota bacterium]